MLNFLVTGAHAYTFENYFRFWGAPARPHARVLWYEDVWTRRRLPGGAYVFTDLERLTDAQLDAAGRLADTLVDRGVRVLNHPHRTLRRYDLLHKMHSVGVNPFRALRLHEDLRALRYPVFLRRENSHRGPITDLLHNRAALDAAIAAEPHRRNLLVVEYCHTADATGIFRKFSVLKLGRRIVTRHVIFSKGWVEKLIDVMEPATLQEELDYIHTNPDLAATAKVFDLAGVDYGRIDYSKLDGKIVVWEINTNPSLTRALGAHPQRRVATKETSDALNALIVETAAGADGSEIELRSPATRVTHPLLDWGMAIRRVLGAEPNPVLKLWRRAAWHVVP